MNRMQRAGFFRMNGILAMALLVALGLGFGSGYFRFRHLEIMAEYERQLQAIEAAPDTPEGQLAQWQLLAQPQVHHHLSIVARVSAEQPWLVTHTLGAEGETPEVWGLDVSRLSREPLRRDGMTVILELPAPRLIEHARLVGMNAQVVPHYTRPEDVPDPSARLEYLVDWFLEDLVGALERDIEGARLEVRVSTE
ncbi:MAG: hypothetical protein O7B99_09405 [Planctomycetota bacterium]|nr:hypothetical protein [Planctomycetota bacterium]